MQKQSEILTAFYRAYLDFAEGKQTRYFTKACGLCHNLFWFLHKAEKPYVYYEVLAEMEQQFIDAGLNKAYPFNNGADDYEGEKEGNNIPNNQKRLDWVRLHAQ